MVNWQAADADFRFLAALFADPNFKPDPVRTAQLFGRDASVRAINHQIQKYRRAARELIEEAQGRGVNLNATPSALSRTPRTPRNLSAGSSRSRTAGSSQRGNGVETPTKAGRKGKGKAKDTDMDMDMDMDMSMSNSGTAGVSMMDAIRVDSGEEAEEGEGEGDEIVDDNTDDKPSLLSVAATSSKSEIATLQAGIKTEPILKIEEDLSSTSLQHSPAVQLFGRSSVVPGTASKAKKTSATGAGTGTDSGRAGTGAGTGAGSSVESANADFSMDDIFGRDD